MLNNSFSIGGLCAEPLKRLGRALLVSWPPTCSPFLFSFFMARGCLLLGELHEFPGFWRRGGEILLLPKCLLISFITYPTPCLWDYKEGGEGLFFRPDFYLWGILIKKQTKGSTLLQYIYMLTFFFVYLGGAKKKNRGEILLFFSSKKKKTKIFFQKILFHPPKVLFLCVCGAIITQNPTTTPGTNLGEHLFC